MGKKKIFKYKKRSIKTSKSKQNNMDPIEIPITVLLILTHYK